MSTKEPNARERIIAKELIKGSTQREALIAAGFSGNNTGIEGPLHSDGVREAFRRAMRVAGITDEHIAATLLASTNATKVYRAAVDGVVITREEDPDHTERRRAVELAAKLLDLAPPQATAEVNAVQVNITFAADRE